MTRDFTPPAVCPICGEVVPRDATACPGCGADERTGWNDEATRYDGLDLPDAAYGDEQTEAQARGAHGLGLWPFVAILLLILFVIALVMR
jgi:hypothetical protein